CVDLGGNVASVGAVDSEPPSPPFAVRLGLQRTAKRNAAVDRENDSRTRYRLAGEVGDHNRETRALADRLLKARPEKPLKPPRCPVVRHAVERVRFVHLDVATPGTGWAPSHQTAVPCCRVRPDDEIGLVRPGANPPVVLVGRVVFLHCNSILLRRAL